MAKKKSFNPATFWAKQIGLAVILIAVAALVINSQNEKAATARQKAPKKNIDNSLSSFYASHRMSSTEPIEDELGDFVVELNRDNQSLSKRLQQMEKGNTTVGGRWVGEHKYRTFKAGSTLREAITSYAQDEGMQVIWELEQDFIVKSNFQMDDTIVGSLYKISKAVDSSFEGNVTAYICPKQRSLVITTERSDYLNKNCSLADGTQG